MVKSAVIPMLFILMVIQFLLIKENSAEIKDQIGNEILLDVQNGNVAVAPPVLLCRGVPIPENATCFNGQIHCKCGFMMNPRTRCIENIPETVCKGECGEAKCRKAETEEWKCEPECFCQNGFRLNFDSTACEVAMNCKLQRKENDETGEEICENRNAICQEDNFEEKGFKCVCKNDFKGDGRTQCKAREKCSNLSVPDNGFCRDGRIRCNCGKSFRWTNDTTKQCQEYLCTKANCGEAFCSSKDPTTNECLRQPICYCSEDYQLNGQIGEKMACIRIPCESEAKAFCAKEGRECILKSNGNYSCLECENGFEKLENIDHCTKIDACKKWGNTFCRNKGATCRAVIGRKDDYECYKCMANYEGEPIKGCTAKKFCTDEAMNECNLKNAECLPTGADEFKCEPCKKGFEKNSSQGKCLERKTCDYITQRYCDLNNAECVVKGVGLYECGQCKTGFEKKHLSNPICKEIDPCWKNYINPCSDRNSYCRIKKTEYGGYECYQCKNGFEGNPKYGCTSKICKLGGAGQHHCGTKGEACIQTGNNNYTCGHCLIQLVRNHQGECIEKDPCAVSIGNQPAGDRYCNRKNAECLKTGFGTYECQCSFGYQGDPKIGCTEIDACNGYSARGQINCVARGLFCESTGPNNFKCVK